MKRKLRDVSMWLFLLCKRLLKKPSFIVLLLLIPICSAALAISFSEESGVMTIGLYSEGSSIGDEIVDSLLKKESILSFRSFESEAQAKKAVEEEKIHAAWIFPKELSENIDTNARYGALNTLARIYEREDTIPLKLSHELLYGSLHPYVARANYERFVERKYGDKAPTDSETLDLHYANAQAPGEIIIIKTVGKEQVTELSDNILTMPMRGILSLMCVLCALACMMYFLSDKRNGIFSRLSEKYHIFPATGTVLCGTVLSSAAVLCSVFLLGINVSIAREVFAMILYCLAVCGFCLTLGLLVRSVTVLSGMTPFVIIIMLVQCPIFFNMDSLRPLWFLFPPSYYLYAVYDTAYMWYMALYAAVSLLCAYIINTVLQKVSLVHHR